MNSMNRKNGNLGRKQGEDIFDSRIGLLKLVRQGIASSEKSKPLNMTWQTLEFYLSKV